MTTEEEVLTPGPDGRLISTDERMQQVRQAQSESPALTSTDGEWLTLSALCMDVVCVRSSVVFDISRVVHGLLSIWAMH